MRRRTWCWLAMLLCSALLLGACGSDADSSDGGDESTSAAEAAAPKPNPDLKGTVTLGAILPVTGGSAPTGEDMQRGVDLAVQAVNSGEGVLGKKLAVKVEDSEGTTVASVQAARKLVNVDHVPVVVGEYLSANSIAIHKYAQGAKVVAINPGGSSPDLADVGDFSFSTIASDAKAGKFAAEQLYDAGYRKIGMITPNTPFGSGISDAVKARFEELGGDITESILYQEGQSSYRSEMERLKDSGAEGYLYASYIPDSITLNKDAFKLGIEPERWYGMYVSLVVQDVDPAAVAGQQGQDLNYVGPSGQGYRKAYEQKYGEDVKTPYGTLYYDSVMMAVAAINEAGSTDPAKIQAALKKIGQGYEGATGTITFDENNLREEQPYELLRADDEGKLQPIDAIEGPAD